MSRIITIYGKVSCPYTQAARREYAKQDVTIEYKDVLEDQTIMEEMLKLSNGRRQVPVIIEGDKVTIGFGGT